MTVSMFSKREQDAQRLSDNRASIQRDVAAERSRQLKKFGGQNHPMPMWITILMEEVGEFSKQVLNEQFDPDDFDEDNLYEEMIQVAAVASAIAQQLRFGGKV